MLPPPSMLSHFCLSRRFPKLWCQYPLPKRQFPYPIRKSPRRHSQSIDSSSERRCTVRTRAPVPAPNAPAPNVPVPLSILIPTRRPCGWPCLGIFCFPSLCGWLGQFLGSCRVMVFDPKNVDPKNGRNGNIATMAETRSNHMRTGTVASTSREDDWMII
jgi:hypothetical protein